jgi:hypothetical protein
MTDIQRLMVDEHIRRLTDEGAARRAERDLARRRHPYAEPFSPTLDVEGHAFQSSPIATPRPAGVSARVRIGRWLVSVGATIAGTDAAVSGAVRRAAAEAAKQTLRRPRGDAPRGLNDDAEEVRHAARPAAPVVQLPRRHGRDPADADRDRTSRRGRRLRQPLGDGPLVQLPEDSGWGGPEHPMLEAYTTLGFLARATDRIALGPLVVGVHFRHPARS